MIPTKSDVTPESHPVNVRAVGRRQVNHEQTMARFAAGTLERIKRALESGEPQAEFIRKAVEAELARREAK